MIRLLVSTFSTSNPSHCTVWESSILDDDLIKEVGCRLKENPFILEQLKVGSVTILSALSEWKQFRSSLLIVFQSDSLR